MPRVVPQRQFHPLPTKTSPGSRQRRYASPSGVHTGNESSLGLNVTRVERLAREIPDPDIILLIPNVECHASAVR